ncbi:nitrosoguanidine resistance protein [Seiridium cupressi]
MKIYARIHPARIIVMRFLNSLLYCMIGSLCVASTIWAFRTSWSVDGNQWALTWISLWLFAHLNFEVLDVFTVWLPIPYVPMALISWTVMNVTSILLPLELSPDFYRIGYMFPAHEVYETLLDIWSRGCNLHLRYSLPILFAWEILGFILSALGVLRRSHYATLAEEKQEKQFNERLNAAIEFGRHRDDEHKGQMDNERQRNETKLGDETKLQDTQRLAVMINREDSDEKKLQRTLWTCNFGPSFDMPFVVDDSSSVDSSIPERRESVV